MKYQLNQGFVEIQNTIDIEENKYRSMGVNEQVHLFGPLHLGRGVHIAPGGCVGMPIVPYKRRRSPCKPSRPTFVGEDVYIGHSATIYTGVVIGKGSCICDGARVCHGVTIGEESYICQNATLSACCKIGSRTKILDLCHITQFGEIGDDCFISMGVILANDNSMGAHEDPNDFRPPRIGNRVRIGMNTSIAPGVTIGDDCIVSGSSLVTKSVPPGWIVRGIPAVPIREVTKDVPG